MARFVSADGQRQRFVQAVGWTVVIGFTLAFAGAILLVFWADSHRAGMAVEPRLPAWGGCAAIVGALLLLRLRFVTIDAERRRVEVAPRVVMFTSRALNCATLVPGTLRRKSP